MKTEQGNPQEEHQMSGSESSPEFERKLQEIGAKSAHMIIPRSEAQHAITELRYPAWEEETPMTDSEELFALICGRTTTKAVERILAAGYRKPRTVTTVEHQMSDMADVLAEHQIGLAWEDGEERGITCICGQDLPTEQERGEIDMTFLAAHQAAALSAAGFGPVKEAEESCCCGTCGL